MNRDDFLAQVRELAEQLGAEIWSIVERQTERARAAALEVAVGRLRGELGGGADEPESAIPRRSPRRCSSCRQLGHDARKCPGSASGDSEPPAPAAEPEPLEASPPYTIRPVRPARGRGPRAERGALTCRRRSRIGCCAPRATTCRRPAGHRTTTGARSTPICRRSPC